MEVHLLLLDREKYAIYESQAHAPPSTTAWARLSMKEQFATRVVVNHTIVSMLQLFIQNFFALERSSWAQITFATVPCLQSKLHYANENSNSVY